MKYMIVFLLSMSLSPNYTQKVELNQLNLLMEVNCEPSKPARVLIHDSVPWIRENYIPIAPYSIPGWAPLPKQEHYIALPLN